MNPVSFTILKYTHFSGLWVSSSSEFCLSSSVSLPFCVWLGSAASLFWDGLRRYSSSSALMATFSGINHLLKCSIALWKVGTQKSWGLEWGWIRICWSILFKLDLIQPLLEVGLNAYGIYPSHHTFHPCHHLGRALRSGHHEEIYPSILSLLGTMNATCPWRSHRWTDLLVSSGGSLHQKENKNKLIITIIIKMIFYILTHGEGGVDSDF